MCQINKSTATAVATHWRMSLARSAAVVAAHVPFLLSSRCTIASISAGVVSVGISTSAPHSRACSEKDKADTFDITVTDATSICCSVPAVLSTELARCMHWASIDKCLV